MYPLARPAALAALTIMTIVALAACDSKPGGGGPKPSSDSAPQLGPNVSGDASRGDDVYTPYSNVEQQAAIAVDAGDIMQAASQSNLDSIRGIYENGKNARGSSLRSLARDEGLADEFPTEASFFGTTTFLDAPLMEAINGSGVAASYTPAQRRQAISAEVQRLMAYTMLHQMQIAEAKLRKGDPDPDDRSHNYVDRAWAFYTATTEGEKRPGSLATTAAELERAFGRDGTI